MFTERTSLFDNEWLPFLKFTPGIFRKAPRLRLFVLTVNPRGRRRPSHLISWDATTRDIPADSGRETRMPRHGPQRPRPLSLAPLPPPPAGRTVLVKVTDSAGDTWMTRTIYRMAASPCLWADWKHTHTHTDTRIVTHTHTHTVQMKFNKPRWNFCDPCGEIRRSQWREGRWYTKEDEN